MIFGTLAFLSSARRSVPLKVIADIVGHSDVRLTQNVYQHVYSEAKQEAASKMDEILKAANAPGNPVATTVATKSASSIPN